MLPLIDTTFAVQTPERVRFELRVAGPGPRAAAWALDLILRLVLLGFVQVLTLIGASALGMPGVGTGFALLFLFLSEWWWGALLETFFDGRTPGKMALGLRVVRDDGSPAGFGEHTLRNLLRAVDILPLGYAFAVASMVFDGQLRRIGDRVAGCVVVHDERSRILDALVLDPPITEAERRLLPPGVVLSRSERTAIEGWMRRRPHLSPGRAEELAALLAPRLTETTGVRGDTAARTLVLAWARATGRDG